MAELALGAEELWIGEMRGVQVGTARLLVVRTEQGVCVFRDRCPHQGFPLSEGQLADGVITCRVHRHTFDAASGAGINPPAPCLVPLRARLERGRLHVELPESGLP